MSQFIKFYLTSSMLNMFRALIHPPSGACDFSIVSPHWLCVLVSMYVGVSVWLVGVVSVWHLATRIVRLSDFKQNGIFSTDLHNSPNIKFRGKPSCCSQVGLHIFQMTGT